MDILKVPRRFKMQKQLQLFLTANSLFALSMGMFGPIYAIFVQDIGGDILAAGTAWAIFMITSGLGIFLIGNIEDKAKRDKPFILFGYALMSLAFIGYFFVSTVYQLFVIQVILGISTVVTIPANDSFYSKYLEKGRFASQWAVWEGLWFFVSGIAALIGAFLVKIFNFRVLFLIMFFTSLIGFILATQLKEK